MKLHQKIILVVMTGSAAHFCYAGEAAAHGAHEVSRVNMLQKPSVVVDQPIQAQDSEEASPLTGSLTFTSNYVFRGITNSNNNPAVQGSLTYTFIPTGIYLNVWSSNVDFLAPDGAQATIEIDTIAGISNSIGDHFEYNFSVARYNYPKAHKLEYNEVLGNIGYYFLTASAAYSGNEYNVGKPGFYYNGGVKFDIPAIQKYLENMSLAATIGRFNLPKEAGKSYNDYSVTLSKDIKNYTLALQWTDTNHKFYDNSYDHAHIVGTLTANF